MHYSPSTRVRTALLAIFAGWLGLSGCGDRVSSAPSPAPRAVSELPDDAPRITDKQPRAFPGLENVVAYDRDVFSGSLPEGAEGFDSLRRLGVQTIISVDGALPNLEPAHTRGLRYVHLPIGYDSVPESRKLELARAIRDLPHPIYIHCHHGKHRSAAATGAALVALGNCSAQAAVERMRVSGTAPSYKGLYASVAASAAVSNEALAAADASFPEITPPVRFVRAMIEIERIDDRLKAIQRAGWKTPDDHPDLVPAAEAGQLADLYRNLLTDPRVNTEPAAFRDQLAASQSAAQSLEDAIVAGASPDELTKRVESIRASCRSCHAQFRDSAVH